MMCPKEAAYGTWESPVSAQLLASSTVQLSEVVVNERTQTVYYVESRPSEAGRRCIVESRNGMSRDVLPKQYSAATGIHEYGGAAVAIRKDGILIFTDAETRGVFSLDPDTGEIDSLIEPDKLLRYGAFDAHPQNPNWVLAVREDHREEVVENCIVAINTTTKEGRVIAKGADFYSHPKFSPDGKMICWLEWRFPDMPWTGTLLFTADWNDGNISDKYHHVGIARTESISQPRWGIDDTLFFTSDCTGFWQLYQLKCTPDRTKAVPKKIQVLGLEEVELSKPEWLLGARTFVPLTAHTLVVAYTRDALCRIAIINIDSGEYYTDRSFPILDTMDDTIVKVSDDSFVVLGRTETTPQALYRINLRATSISKVLEPLRFDLPDSIYSKAQHVTFERVYGDFQPGQAFCLFFPPHNPSFKGPPGKLPPLILSVHGGPTGHTTIGLFLRTQYWTSRGYAVAALNFTGSSGYGRRFRERMNGRWGLIDIADAASCVKHLANAGLIDESRVGIRGGSGGGYATLQALCEYPNVWRGGVSEYGVSELKMLANETHKFESQYLQGLLWKDGTSIAEQEKIYHDRSPLYNAQKITAPLLLLQGTEDHVVPPNQAQEMERIIKKRGGVVRLIFFLGEGHGFRKEASIWRAIEEEEQWWVRQLVES